MGRHKDLECPQCHYNFQVSASEEVDRDGNEKKGQPKIDYCICPMCRYVWDGEEGPIAQSAYHGDRILVNKFAYQVGDPERWDVIVFKFPQNSQENYIKRLIGLPSETVKVHRGDIWIKGEDAREFEIARKPPEKLRVMLQPVFDDELMPTIEKIGWPARWRAELPPDGSAAGQWTSDDRAVFETDGSAAGEAWLRYEHLVPTESQWADLERKLPADASVVKPQLISDFTAYNSGGSGGDRMEIRNDFTGKHWVGDLAVQCQAEVENGRGQIVLELVKGGRKFQCRIDAGSGLAEFSIDGLEKSQFDHRTPTVVKGPGKYELKFANCDRRLYLWINGGIVLMADYPDLRNDIPDRSDLQPAGIASRGVKLKAGHIKLFRDIYYVAANAETHNRQLKVNDPGHFYNITMCDYKIWPPGIKSGDYADFFADPRQWQAFEDNNMEQVFFSTKDDQFFAMGDNSAKSADGRTWGVVPRKLLIGKAFFVYWPHSWHRIPGTKIPFPFFPNFTRMGFVR
ncbi:MAG: signal peptidase I [Pirellulales bacterium]|nr:signal peptidase I [Pirellulales bacterium]